MKTIVIFSLLFGVAFGCGWEESDACFLEFGKLYMVTDEADESVWLTYRETGSDKAKVCLQVSK